MKKLCVLVVEDDEAIMLGLEENLKFDGYDVITATDGNLALKLGLENRPDLVLLDIMLPGMSGYDVCRKLRDAGADMPVIMLTARQDEFDKLHGFEMGADDYVTKPFSIKELLARIRAVMKRGKSSVVEQGAYEFGDCILDSESRILTRNGKEVVLTRTEFDLLAYFCRNEGKALSRDTVMNDVWGTEYFGTQRSLDSFVASLRSKIEKKAGAPHHILTVHGVGYKFVKGMFVH
ncbi:MAG: response regulator transcription factor [Kiritimatiellae bacterium]|nr:response regulator transcription factor [Kiritimatiellia bacterium]